MSTDDVIEAVRGELFDPRDRLTNAQYAMIERIQQAESPDWIDVEILGTVSE